MSRLIDRILAFGCAPFRPFDLFSDEELRDLEPAVVGEEASRGPGRSPRVLRANQPSATEKFDPLVLVGAPVISADEVAEYCSGFEARTDPGDVVSVLAPPFDRFFVEFRAAPSTHLHAWGALMETWMEGTNEDDVRWHLGATLIIEPRKGHPVGPVVRWVMAIDPEGRWLRDEEEGYVSGGVLPEMEDPPPEDIADHLLAKTLPLLLPALMTISFMHCRNVEAQEIEPPELVSRKWRKKRGRPLVRYHVLDIAPMRRVLEQQGQAREKGISHAMHLCRGHFKTYTEEAPLFGRITGQFWWADHVRGHAEHGTVLKDYRLSVEQPRVGRPYEDVDEEATSAPPERTIFDPDAAGRGRQAHNRTQNALAAEVHRAGLQPRRPKADEPNYDLAWERDSELVVAEIKSLTEANEERQLRIAIGQVVRYRHQLSLSGPAAQAMIAAERRPSDDSWLDLCDEQGIILAWPGAFPDAVRGAGRPS